MAAESAGWVELAGSVGPAEWVAAAEPVVAAEPLLSAAPRVPPELQRPGVAAERSEPVRGRRVRLGAGQTSAQAYRGYPNARDKRAVGE